MDQFSSLLTGSAKNMNLLDPNEVSANRMGQLTDAQDKRLTATAMGGGCATFAGPLIFAVIFAFILFTMLIDSSSGWFVIIPLIILGAIAIPFSGAIIDWFQLNSKLKIDRANKAIRSAVGELSFDRKKGYFIQAGEQKLRLPPSANVGGLTPGVRYNFYFLPESAIVLSAEQLGTPSTAQMRSAFTNILATANNFTLEDLQANQQNEISAGQRNRAIGKSLTGLIPVALFLLVFLVIFVQLILAENATSSEAMLPFIFIGFFFLLFGGIAIWNIVNTFMDLSSGTPEMLEGPGTKTSRQKGSGKSRRTVYYYVIGGKEFEVTHTAYNALINGQNYRVYYTPRTSRLLSIEATGGSDSPFNF